MSFIKVKAKSVNKDVSRHKIYFKKKNTCFCESLLIRDIKEANNVFTGWRRHGGIR